VPTPSGDLLGYTEKMAIPTFSTDIRTRAPASPQLKEFLDGYSPENLEITARASWARTEVLISLADWAIARAVSAYEENDPESFNYATDMFEGTRNLLIFTQQLGKTAQTGLMVKKFIRDGELKAAEAKIDSIRTA
jgi:hypothetical protein